MVAVLSMVAMLALSVSPAFAYSSSVSAEGSVDCTCVYVNICSYTGSGSSSSSMAFDESSFAVDKTLTFADSIKITQNTQSKKYSISGTATLSGHYVVVLGNVSGLKLSATVTEDGGNVSKISYSLNVGGSSLSTDGTGTISVTAGYAYAIDFTANLNNTGYNSSTAPELPDITLSFSLIRDTGTSSVEIQKISIKYTSTVAASDLIDANEDKVTDEDKGAFTGSDGNTYYIVADESRTDGYAAVYITESEDSTDFTTSVFSKDTSSVKLTIPSDRDFVVMLYIEGNWAGGGSSVSLTVTIDGTSYTGSLSSNRSSNGYHYFYISDNTSKTLASVSDVSKVPDTSWMKGDNVTLSVTGTSTTLSISSATLEIIMK